MEVALLEYGLGLVVLLIGWLHMRQNRLEIKLESCVERSAFEEVKEDLKEAVHLLQEVRVENAKWQGLMEEAIRKGSERS